MRSTVVVLVAAVAGSVVCPALELGAEGQDGRALVLDSKAATVSAVDLSTGKVAGRLQLQGRPEAMLRTPDGSRLVLLDRGPGKDKGRRGYKAKGPAVATIVDAAALTVLHRVELGGGLHGRPSPLGIMSADGSGLSVICPGYESKKPAERRPRELVTVDLTTGDVTARVSLERPVDHLALTADGRTLVLFAAFQKKPRQPAQLWFVDLEGAELSGPLDLDGEPGGPVLSPDERFLYHLDEGKPSKKPSKNINGRLHVVSLATRMVEATIDVGREPRGADDRRRRG